MKSEIHLYFRTGIKFHPLTITTSFLHSNIKEIKYILFLSSTKDAFFSTKDAFLSNYCHSKFLNYSVWSMALEYQSFISVSSKYKKTKRFPLPFIVL